MVLMLWRFKCSCYYLNLWTIPSHNVLLQLYFIHIISQYAHHCGSMNYISWKCNDLIEVKENAMLFYYKFILQCVIPIITIIFMRNRNFHLLFIDNKMVFEQN